MSVSNFNPRTLVLLGFIAATALVRVVLNFQGDVSDLANFSPLGAMALFGGAYFQRSWKAFLFPLGMLLASDLLLHATVFKQYSDGGFLYGGWMWVYGALALMVLVGRWMLRKVSVANVLSATLVCVLIHWIVTDIPVWYGSTFFSQDLAGYVNCLIAAIPFEVRFLTGTLVYGSLLFGAFEWMQRRNAQLMQG